MINKTAPVGFQEEYWEALEKLVSANSLDRDSALDYLHENGLIWSSPLAAYLLATRTTDEDLEVRFHAIRIMGALLDFENSQGRALEGVALENVHSFFKQCGKDQILRLLEVGERYLAAENALLNIFKISSYAGDLLGGIVNDRKLPASIRQQAIYFGGEAGFLELVQVFQNLIFRIDKNRERMGRNLTDKLIKEEDLIYSSANVALGKLNPEIKRIGKI